MPKAQTGFDNISLSFHFRDVVKFSHRRREEQKIKLFELQNRSVKKKKKKERKKKKKHLVNTK